jgi:hypothetical protein
MFDNDPGRGAMRDDYSKGVTKLIYRVADDGRDNYGRRAAELALDNYGLRVEKEVFWLAYQRFVYAIER